MMRTLLIVVPDLYYSGAFLLWSSWQGRMSQVGDWRKAPEEALDGTDGF